MRPFILVAASAIAIATTISANAGALTGAGGLRSATEQLGVTEPVARVCREVCREGICRKRCVFEPDGFRARGEFRDRGEWRDRREYRGERRPGVQIEGPGVEFRVR